MSIAKIHEVTARLSSSANALAIFAAALDSRITGVPFDPALAPQAKEVLDALGVRTAIEETPPQELAPVLNEIRTWSFLNRKLFSVAGCTAGWNHAETEILQMMGSNTHGLAMALKRMIAPQLEGLAGRLETSGTTFLDIGSGVSQLSIEIARAIPALRIVDVEPFAPAMALARQNVINAGLSDRIELRHIGGEQLSDESAFDLAWVPSPFIPETILPKILDRVLVALRPGGWMLYAIPRPPTDPLDGPVMRFRVRTFGGGLQRIEDAEAGLKQIGFTEVRTLPTPPGAVAAIIAARRAPAATTR